MAGHYINALVGMIPTYPLKKQTIKRNKNNVRHGNMEKGNRQPISKVTGGFCGLFYQHLSVKSGETYIISIKHTTP